MADRGREEDRETARILPAIRRTTMNNDRLFMITIITLTAVTADWTFKNTSHSLLQLNDVNPSFIRGRYQLFPYPVLASVTVSASGRKSLSPVHTRVKHGVQNLK